LRRIEYLEEDLRMAMCGVFRPPGTFTRRIRGKR
jgi:hypothetical protein